MNSPGSDPLDVGPPIVVGIKLEARLADCVNLSDGSAALRRLEPVLDVVLGLEGFGHVSFSGHFARGLMQGET